MEDGLLFAAIPKKFSLRRHLRLTRIPAQLVQRRLRWFGHAVSCPFYPQRLARGAEELETS